MLTQGSRLQCLSYCDVTESILALSLAAKSRLNIIWHIRYRIPVWATAKVFDKRVASTLGQKHTDTHRHTQKHTRTHKQQQHSSHGPIRFATGKTYIPWQRCPQRRALTAAVLKGYSSTSIDYSQLCKKPNISTPDSCLLQWSTVSCQNVCFLNSLPVNWGDLKQADTKPTNRFCNFYNTCTHRRKEMLFLAYVQYYFIDLLWVRFVCVKFRVLLHQPKHIPRPGLFHVGITHVCPWDSSRSEDTQKFTQWGDVLAGEGREREEERWAISGT